MPTPVRAADVRQWIPHGWSRSSGVGAPAKVGNRCESATLASGPSFRLMINFAPMVSKVQRHRHRNAGGTTSPGIRREQIRKADPVGERGPVERRPPAPEAVLPNPFHDCRNVSGTRMSAGRGREVRAGHQSAHADRVSPHPTPVVRSATTTLVSRPAQAPTSHPNRDESTRGLPRDRRLRLSWPACGGEMRVTR